jgi:hypothetical protein
MNERDFIARHLGSAVELSAEASHLLDAPSFRQGVLREIHRSPSIDASGLLRAILDREANCWLSGKSEEYFENLHWCAFLLWRVGDLRDVIPLWRAKNIDFDTACGFDIQFLTGAGLNQTIEYLGSSADPEAKPALEYIMYCRAAGDFDDLQAWAIWRTDYFRE